MYTHLECLQDFAVYHSTYYQTVTMGKQILTQLITKHKLLYLQKNRYQSTNHTLVETHQPLLLATSQPVDGNEGLQGTCRST